MKKNQKKLIAFAAAITLIGSVSSQVSGVYFNNLSGNVYAQENVTFEVKDPYTDDSVEICKRKFWFHNAEAKTEVIEIVDDAVYTFSNGKLTIESKNSKGDACNACLASARVLDRIRDLVTSIEVETGIEYLGDYCFSGFNNVKSISLPSSLKQIGYKALSRMDNLESVSIPDSVVEIQNEALSYLPKIKEITIPSSVIYFGSNVIHDDDSLVKVSVDGTGASVGKEFIANNKSLEEIYFGSGIKFIEYKTVYECPKVKKITIKASDTGIVSHAFWEMGSDEVIELSLPDTVDYIDDASFRNIKSYRISVPKTKTICSEAFYNCTTGDLVINGADKIESIAFGEMNVTDSFSIKNVKGIDRDGFLHAQIKDIDLSSCPGISIGDYAFCGNKKLEHLTLPSSFGTLGKCIFLNCTALTTVDYSSDISGLKEIPSSFFFNCSSLKSLINSSLSEDADNYTINIPSGVETIGECAFEECTAIENVSFPDTLKAIGESAFRVDENISEINIPSGTESIDKYAFADCTKLSKITIPESVTEIGYNAFDKCPSLTIYGYTGSYAETYANKYKIPFAALNKIDDTTTGTSVTEAPVTTDVSKTSPSSQTSDVTTASAANAESSASGDETEAASTITSSSVIDAEILLVGDLNSDGVADLTDLTLLSVNLMDKTLNMENNPQADIDGNGKIDIADLARFKQYISKDSAVKELGIVKRK